MTWKVSTMAKDSVLFSDISNLAKTLYVCVARMIIACGQALLFGQAKQASREHASEGPRKGLSPPPRSLAARLRVLARFVSLAQIGELARRLLWSLFSLQVIVSRKKPGLFNLRGYHFFEVCSDIFIFRSRELMSETFWSRIREEHFFKKKIFTF